MPAHRRARPRPLPDSPSPHTPPCPTPQLPAYPTSLQARLQATPLYPALPSSRPVLCRCGSWHVS